MENCTKRSNEFAGFKTLSFSSKLSERKVESIFILLMIHNFFNNLNKSWIKVFRETLTAKSTTCSVPQNIYTKSAYFIRACIDCSPNSKVFNFFNEKRIFNIDINNFENDKLTWHQNDSHFLCSFLIVFKWKNALCHRIF